MTSKQRVPLAPATFVTELNRFCFGFTLLCDTDNTVAKAYGVWQQKSMYGKKYMGIVRSSFLVDEKGKIIDAWYKVKPEDTVPNALDAL